MPENDGVTELKILGKPWIKAYDDTTGEALILCRECKEIKRRKVTRKQIANWADGALIQRAMPELSRDETELFISGTCSPCFDKLWEET